MTSSMDSLLQAADLGFVSGAAMDAASETHKNSLMVHRMRSLQSPAYDRLCGPILVRQAVFTSILTVLTGQDTNLFNDKAPKDVWARALIADLAEFMLGNPSVKLEPDLRAKLEEIVALVASPPAE